MTNSTFVDNGGSGSYVILSQKSLVNITHCNFTGTICGRFISFFNYATGFVSNCYFQNNHAGDLIQLVGQSIMQVTDSNFMDIYSHDMLSIESSSTIEIVHCNFSRNLGNRIMTFNNAHGFISCCFFQHITSSYRLNYIVTEAQSSLYVANTTFRDISVRDSIIALNSIGDQVSVVSSLFTFIDAGYMIKSDERNNVTVLASDFSHNTGTAIGGGHVILDCNNFFNSSVNEPVKNTTFCSENFILGQQENCAANNCEGMYIIRHGRSSS